METILLTGATGFVGDELRYQLLRGRYRLVILTRNPARYKEEHADNQKFISWDDDWESELKGCKAVINLAGESIFGQRWTRDVKKRIYNSRIETTRLLVNAIAALDEEKRPELMISASAVGVYGDTGDQEITEEASPGSDFLAEVCVEWEAEARHLEQSGVRLVIPRIGIVLEEGGGAIAQMKTPFQLFAGGPVGSGKQYVPWIHRTDLCRFMEFALENENCKGVYNLSAPNPVTMGQLADALGNAMHRPSWMKVPSFALKMAFGEAAGPILNSTKAIPKKLQEEDFEFRFEEIHDAMNDIVS